MATGKVATDFNAIINADRQKRKNEALAKEIFSKGRRQSAPAGGATSRKPGTGPSLASRIGVAKRMVSTTQKNALARSNLKPKPPPTKPAAGNVDSEWTHDLHSLNNPSAPRAAQPRGPKRPHITKTERLYNAVNGSASSPALNSQFNVIGTAKATKAISIKGLAGPYIVMAKNFAQGTTVDDIESAMTPVGGVCLSCRVVTESPSVIAEIIFESKEGADNVVLAFNNQNADGNVLHVFHKVGAALKISAPKPTAPLGPRADRIDTVDRRGHGSSSDRYIPPNERRRENESRAAVVDGSCGFDERMETDDQDDYDKGARLYSDEIGSRGRGGRERVNQRGRGFR